MPKPRRKSDIRAAAFHQAAALREAAEQSAAFLQPSARSWHDMFLAALRSGQSVGAAAAAAGVSRSGVYKARLHESGFRAAWTAALASARRQRQQAQAAAAGPHWLTRVLPAPSAPAPFNDAIKRFDAIRARSGRCDLGPPEVDSLRLICAPSSHADSVTLV